YSYRDRVWFDLSEDQQDGGENGIAGVTVNLLNAARQVIATVTTDANGYFDFSGLQGSTLYYVEVSDTASVLSNFFGTTPEAVAGELQLANLTANVDFTAEPNFGYNAYGAVGDTVFNDLNGNGLQDPGEAGLAGVTVRLITDADGDGIIDAGDNQIRTLVTDANGHYVFAGIPNGSYIVSITSPPAGYTFTGTDSDGTAGGQQLQATVVGGGADLTADFGYRVATSPRTVSGTLFNDANNNGTLDDVGRFANVTVELRNSAGTMVIATTTTNASGNYSFTGLPPVDDYRVRITDNNGILSGYQTTYEVSEGPLASSYDGFELVNLSGGDASNINFGYYRPPSTPLAVSLSSFHAELGGRGTRFRWTTDNEVGNLGFYLLGEVNDEWVDFSDDLIPSSVIDSSSRQQYSYESDRRDASRFILIDVDVSGKARYHGPFAIGQSDVSDPPSQMTVDWTRVRAEHTTKLAARQADAFSRGTPPAVRLLIEGKGLYRLSYESLAAQGFNYSGVRVSTMGLFDRNGPVPMAVVPEGSTFGPGMAIEFVAEPSGDLYNKRNYYTLRTDKSGATALVDDQLPGGSPQTTYQETTRIENDSRYSYGAPNGDPWYDTWVQAISGPATLTRNIPVEDLVPGAGSASLSLNLWGVTYWPAAPDHRVVASLNGVELVNETFDGHVSWQHQVAIS
ncbi:MAG: carboxypeptidase regulatory-like domain-containing protein, partial [Xanthomonadales bacterium]|nr:carboxypeptidase regulatory-like domain-containing protein [Xanthomonadales bacterium]